MAISLASLARTTSIEPPKIVLYGPNGIGKTTFASEAPNPVFIFTERGVGMLNVEAFPFVTKYAQLIECLESLLNETHKFQTVVLDSVDATEKLIAVEAVARYNATNSKSPAENLGDVPYRRGFEAAQNLWLKILQLLDRLNTEKKMAVITLGHSLVKTFSPPDMPAYDQYRFDVHDKCASVVKDWADCIFFVNYKTFTKVVDKSFGKDEHQALGGTERVMMTEHRPAFWAKNRYNLPFEIPFEKNKSFANFARAFALSTGAVKATKEKEPKTAGAVQVTNEETKTQTEVQA